MQLGMKPHLGAGRPLVAHVDLRGGVVTHQHHRQPRLAFARRDHGLDLGPDAGANLRRDGLTIENLGAHGIYLGSVGKGQIIATCRGNATKHGQKNPGGRLT